VVIVVRVKVVGAFGMRIALRPIKLNDGRVREPVEKS